MIQLTLKVFWCTLRQILWFFVFNFKLFHFVPAETYFRLCGFPFPFVWISHIQSIGICFFFFCFNFQFPRNRKMFFFYANGNGILCLKKKRKLEMIAMETEIRCVYHEKEQNGLCFANVKHNKTLCVLLLWLKHNKKKP